MVAVRNCERCGGEFARSPKYSESQWASKRFCSRRCGALRRNFSDDEIVQLYKSGLSSTEISQLVRVSATHVSRIVNCYGAMRSPSERIVLSHSRPDVRARIAAAKAGHPCPESTKEILRGRIGPKNHNWRSGLTLTVDGYLVFSSSPANGAHAGRCLHVVIAEWKIGRPLQAGEAVHHVDGNKLNNDPENIEVMLATDHARLHAIKSGFGRSKCQEA